MRAMIKLVFLLCAAVVTGSGLNAKDWYAAPDAAGDGNGSKTNPWTLQAALSQKAVMRPGDTLYLRSGSYAGCFVSTLNNITIRSYPGEWAVIQGGAMGVLQQNIGSTNASATIA